MRTPKQWERSRRQLLRDLGLGAACLPLLRAGMADAAPVPKKLLIVAAINGYRMNNWQPMDGALTVLPKSLSGLELHKGEIVVLHDLTNPGFTGCMACAESSYATIYSGLPPRPGSGPYQEPNGPTLDQVIGHGLPTSGARPTFNAAVQLNLSLLKSSPPGARLCFWVDKQQPINPQLDPLAAYNELFAGAVDPSATRRLLAERKSILDYVSHGLDRFKAKLGSDDRAVMDAHQVALRQTEMELGGIVDSGCGAINPGTIDLTDINNYFKVLSALIKIELAVLRCGISQVATLQLSDATGTYINFGAFVPGIPARGTGYKSAYRNWKDLGHNPVLGGVDQKQIVDQWWMDQLADIVAQMKGSLDPGGTSMFDNSVVLWGNNMHEGEDHGAQRLPWILAGKAGGYFKTGQCLPGKTTTAVLADVCAAMGVTQHPYGATTPGLRA
jgi:hypothetical protein